MSQMKPYLHNSKNLHLIAQAAKMEDIDAAVLSVMVENDITEGDIAGQMFADVDWPNATTREREQALGAWLRVELQSR